MRSARLLKNYLVHLKAQAEAKGKPPRWWANACKLSRRTYAAMGRWTLSEIAEPAERSKTWHAKALEVHPNNRRPLRTVIRACYAAKRRGLIATLTPGGLATSRHKAWKDRGFESRARLPRLLAWRKGMGHDRNPVHKGLNLAALLTGLSANRACHDPRERYRSRRAAHDHSETRKLNDISLPDQGRDCFPRWRWPSTRLRKPSR